MVKNPPAHAGDVRDTGSIPESGRSPGGGHGNSLQYSFLENSVDRGAWKATVHWVTKSQMQLKRLSTHTPKYELLGAKVLCYLQISIWTAPAGFRGKHVMSPALKGLGVKSQLQH